MQSVPNYPNDVTIAGGTVLFSANGIDWEDLGSVKKFAVKVETEQKDHINSRNGLRKLAKTFVTKITASGSIEANISTKENINKFFMGDAIASVVQNSGSLADEEFDNIALGKWRHIDKSNLSSVVVKAASVTYGLGAVTAGSGNGGTAVLNTPTQGASILAGTYTITYDTNHYELENPDEDAVVLSKVEGTAVYTSPELGFTVASGSPSNGDTWTCVVTGTPSSATMAVGTDYLLEAEPGFIMVKSDNTKSVAEGGSITVSCNYASKTQYRVDAASKNQWKGHVWFIGDPAGGVRQQVKGYVNLKPSGEFGGIAEEEQSFNFDFTFQEHANYVNADGERVLFQYFDRGSVDAE